MPDDRCAGPADKINVLAALHRYQPATAAFANDEAHIVRQGIPTKACARQGSFSQSRNSRSCVISVAVAIPQLQTSDHLLNSLEDCVFRHHTPVRASTTARRGSPMIITSSSCCPGSLRVRASRRQRPAAFCTPCPIGERTGQSDVLDRQPARLRRRVRHSRPSASISIYSAHPRAVDCRADASVAALPANSGLSSPDEPHDIGFRQGYLVGQFTCALEHLFHAHGIH